MRIGTVGGAIAALFMMAPFSMGAPPAASPSADAEPTQPRTLRIAAGAFPVDRASYESLKPLHALSLSNIDIAGGASLSLELERFSVLADDAVLVAATGDAAGALERPSVALFRGRVRGDEPSSAFLGVSPFGVYGFVRTDSDTWIISSGAAGQGLSTVIYSVAKAGEDPRFWAPFSCRAIEVPGQIPFLEAGGSRSDPATQCRRVRVAVDTDWEFTGDLFGGNVNASAAYVSTLIGAVSEIYWRDLRAELEISYLRTWTDPNDPWDQPDAGTQLTQFRDHWQGMGDVDRDVAHFLSGRPLGGGVAYVATLCSYEWGFGLSGNLGGGFPYPLQDNHWRNWDPYVVAHEIGHNFAAPHTHDLTPPADGCGLGDCADADLGTIMSYCHTCPGGMTNIRLEFHTRIVAETIAPYLNMVGDCLASAGPFFSLQPEPTQTVCPGDQVVLAVSTDATMPAYQWRRGAVDLADGPNLIGTTGQTMVIIAATLADSDANYNCVVTDQLVGCVTVSEPAEVVVDPYMAVVTQQPQGQTVTQGEPLAISVAVENPVLHTFQWRKDAVPLFNDGRIFGAATPTLTLVATEVSDTGAYDCSVSTPLGANCTVLSDAAEITVEPIMLCPGDVNHDGAVDLSDLSTLLANYGVTTGAAFEDGDGDGDGDVDLADLSALLADYGRTDC